MDGGEPQSGREVTRSEIVKLVALGVAASIVGIAIVLAIDWFPAQSATAAEDIDTLWDVLLIVSVPVFVLVMAVAIYSVVKFRARPGEKGDGVPIHGNTMLEIVWVTIPFLIVTALAVYGWVVLDDIEAKEPNEMVVDVTGLQFTWEFKYVDEKVTAGELVLPVDQPVKFNIRAKDVIHSFWVPEFRLKQDAVPGITTRIRATPSRTGSWQVVCAELCGLGHSTMRVPVRVVKPAEFDRWVVERKQKASGAKGATTATGSSGDAQ